MTIPILFNNPEFRKNLWLEFSPARLILMPLILGGVFLIAFLATDTPFLDRLSFLHQVALFHFGAIAGIWGCKLASEAVVSEFNDRTWEGQRMTSLGPWEMTVGKLFGSTAYAWYGGIICMAVYAGVAVFRPQTGRHLTTAAVVILAALFIQALALLLSLVRLRRQPSGEKVSATPFFLLGVFGIVFILPKLIPWIMDSEEQVDWFRFTLSSANFSLFSLLFFLGWSLAGIHRHLRAEFGLENGPWAWIFFLTTLMAYYGGFAAGIDDLDTGGRITVGCYIAFGIGLGFTYVMAFTEPKNPVDYRSLLAAVRKRRPEEIGKRLPLWSLSLAMTLLLYLLIFTLSFATGGLPRLDDAFAVTALYLLTILGFACRDICLLLWVNLRSGSPRADAATLLYLVILYGLIPALLWTAGADDLLPVFLPLFDRSPALGTIPVLAQFALFFVLLLRCARRNLALPDP